MKTKTYVLYLLAFTIVQLSYSQQSQTTFPKVEDYTKGELNIKITSFGDNTPITVGKIMVDGTLHFNWAAADISKTSENDYLTQSIEGFYGGKFCRNSNAIITNENAILVEAKYLYVFKYGQPVGAIIPSTQQNKAHDKDQLGSTIYWVYSDVDTSVNANCSEKKEWEDLYSFNQTIAYNITFKKGWNLVSNTLSAIEEWDSGNKKGSLPKTRSIKTLDQIPANIKWQLNYWANDDTLEIEHQLIELKPITKQHYENWLPKKLRKLKRTSYNIGKTIERMPTLNNINLLFERGLKTIDLTIVDCAGSKEAANAYTLILEMASQDWKEDTKTGYRSASGIDGKRVLTDYNEKEAITILNYNTNKRFLIKAEANNIEPDELWQYLKALNLDALSKG